MYFLVMHVPPEIPASHISFVFKTGQFLSMNFTIAVPSFRLFFHYPVTRVAMIRSSHRWRLDA